MRVVRGEITATGEHVQSREDSFCHPISKTNIFSDSHKYILFRQINISYFAVKLLQREWRAC